MTRKRSNAKPKPKAESPITGVAAGGLGTAANLDDTEVLRTADLQAAAASAAASPDWLDDDAVAAAPAPDVIPSDELALLQATPDSTPTAAVAPSRPSRRSRNVPALAGVVAFVALLLIAGSGFLSQLDLGAGSGPAGPVATAGALIDAAPSPSAEPKKVEGKGGRGKCHDHGHGNDCQGGGD